MTALAVASTAASIVTETKAAKTQERAIRTQLEQSNKEINQKATAEVNDRQRATRREQARIKVAAGEAGLQLGGSIDLLLQDSLMQGGLSNERTAQNRENELLSANAEANSMLSRVEKPTLLGAGLRLATAGMQGYSQGTSMKLDRSAAMSRAAGGN
jgi:hypothetical protein